MDKEMEVAVANLYFTRRDTNVLLGEDQDADLVTMITPVMPSLSKDNVFGNPPTIPLY